MRVRRYVVGAVLGLGVVASYDGAAAQVGYDPGRSPFRDVPLRPGPVLFVGLLSGGRGKADAGTSNAVTAGVRYEIPAGKALVFQLGAAYLSGDRFIIDYRADSASPQRRTGPFKSELAMAELAINLRLTGAKSWHRIAPYLGAGVGYVFDVNSPGDTTGSGYRFGAKFSLAGATGVRWYPSRHVRINAEARAQFWRLKYPTNFKVPAPDGSRVIGLLDNPREWTLHPWLSLGIGWTF